LRSKILILRFPEDLTHKALVCNLAKEYGLTFAILHAEIFPRKEGLLVLDLSGPASSFDAGVKYLKEMGVSVKTAAQEITRDENLCIHCGACTAVCPTQALYIKRPEMKVCFDQEKCSICELCVVTCPFKAMIASPKNENFF
jgi:ferredoxin